MLSGSFSRVRGGFIVKIVRAAVVSFILIPTPLSAAEDSDPARTVFADADPDALANPANLMDRKGVTIDTSMAMTTFDLESLGHRSTGQSGLPPDDYDYGDARPLTETKFAINLPSLWGSRLGLMGSMPGDFMRVRVLSGEERSYLRYSEDNQRPHMYTALAFPLPAGFAMGLGIYHTMEASGQAQLGVSEEDTRGRALMDVKPRQVPYGGLRWESRDTGRRLAIDVYYRAESDASTSMDTQIVVDTEDFILPANASANLALFYQPEVYRAGVSWQTRDTGWYLGYEAGRWSRFRAPYVELISDAAPPSQAEPVTLQDTSAWKLGFAWTAIRNALFTTTLHTWLEQHSSALGDNPQNLAIIDLPRRVYSLAGRTRIEFINEGPRNLALQWTIHRTDLESRRLTTPAGEVVSAGGRTMTYAGGLTVEM